jgi:arylesterase/paraoxonase
LAIQELQNAPVRVPKHANFNSFEVKFADRIRNCEDVLLVDSLSVAILACDPGRETWNTVMGLLSSSQPADPNAELYLYRYNEPNLSEEDALVRLVTLDFPSELRTLGLGFDEPSSTLFVTNHKRQGTSIEQFRVDFDVATATYVRSLAHPLLHAPNAVEVLGPDELLVTNQHYFVATRYPILSKLETYLGLPLGTVVHVKIAEDGSVDAHVLARLPYANGVVLLNDTTLAISATSEAAVRLYTLAANASSPPSQPTLTYRSSIDIPFWPDNLSVARRTRSGSPALLIAGHPSLLTLIPFAKSRRFCNRPTELMKPENEHMVAKCDNIARAPSWVAEWTEDGGLRHVYSGSDYPSSATAVRDDAATVGIVSGLYARGIMLWKY